MIVVFEEDDLETNIGQSIRQLKGIVPKPGGAISLEEMDSFFNRDDLDVESPEWQGDVLSARKNKIEEGRAEFS